MSTDENKAIVQRFYEEVWNKQHMDAANDVLAPNYAVNGDTRSPEVFKQQFQGFRPDWSTLQLTIEDMVAEGDKVATRWTMHGIWQATGKPVTAQGISFCRIVDGKIQDYWFSSDPWE
jgi:predicted ester cyclase